MWENKIGDFRVVPYGYRLQRRKRKPGQGSWWNRLVGSRGTDQWETILETQTKDPDKLLKILLSVGTKTRG